MDRFRAREFFRLLRGHRHVFRFDSDSAAVRHGAIMRRVTERAIFFGEAPQPEDVDDLIIHRRSLEGMLDGSYWSGVAL